jgi:hypothetical protein
VIISGGFSVRRSGFMLITQLQSGFSCTFAFLIAHSKSESHKYSRSWQFVGQVMSISVFGGKRGSRVVGLTRRCLT